MRYQNFYHLYEENTEPTSSVSTDTDTTEPITDTVVKQKKEDTPSVEIKDTKTDNSNKPNSEKPLYPSQIQSIVKKEVKKLMDIEKKKISKPQTPSSQQRNQQQKNKSPKHKSTPKQKKNSSNEGFFLSYDRLQPINISPNSLDKLIPFNCKEVNNLLTEHLTDLTIVSVCKNEEKPTISMNHTLLLQSKLIKNKLTYIPIYSVVKNRIVDIVFVVFDTTFLNNPQIRNMFGSFILLKQSSNQWKFSYIERNNSTELRTPYYQSVINYYSVKRGITEVVPISLFVNPPPISRTEEYVRTVKRLEVSFPLKKV